MPGSRLSARRAGIDTYQQAVAYMRSDCPVCLAEGFEAQAQVELIAGGRHLLAILHHVSSDWLRADEIALSEAAWNLLGPVEGAEVEVRHPPLLSSLAHLRSKVHGNRLEYAALCSLMNDISHGRLSDIHLASFVTLCAGKGLDLDETVALTRAMVDVGERLDWGASPVVDKHCIGGLPGNRTTLIVERSADAPADLRARALLLAGLVLEMAGKAAPGEGEALARAVLDDGRALAKFIAICDAQGGMRVPPRADFTECVTAHAGGVVRAIDTRLMGRAAKLAGAPRDPAAGATMHVRIGDRIEVGQPLLTLHAQHPGALQYALGFVRAQLPIVQIEAES